MTEGNTALTLLCVGLTLMIPVACWFGIGIGEERARQQYRMTLRQYDQEAAALQPLTIHKVQQIFSDDERFNDNDIDAQRDWGGRS